MKIYIYATLISAIFVANVFSQVDSQDSASDAPYIPESNATGTFKDLASVMEGPRGECADALFQSADFGHGMIPQQVANSGYIPDYSGNCGVVGPVTYQENYSTPIPQSTAVPTLIGSTADFNFCIGEIRQSPTNISNGESNTISRPVLQNGVQYMPFIPPNNHGSGQTTGRSISLTASPSYNSVIADRTSPTKSSPQNSYALPFGGAVYSPIGVVNCCAPNRAIGARGRFFRRYR